MKKTKSQLVPKDPDGRPYIHNEELSAVRKAILGMRGDITSLRPTSLKIINMIFEVQWVDSTIEEGAQKFGWCSCNKQIIGISDSLKPCKTADTFLHEVIHALNWVMDIKDGAKEEDITNRLSSAICCFWQDNPEAFVWWSELIRSKK